MSKLTTQGTFLLNSIIQNRDLDVFCRLSEDLFIKDEEKELFYELEKHYRNFSCLPLRETLEEKDYKLIKKELEPASFYLEGVLDSYARVKVLEVTENKEKVALLNADEISQYFMSVANEIAILKESDFYSDMSSNIEKALQRAHENKLNTGLIGMPMGLGPIDAMFLGVMPTDLVTVHAPSGTGKSWMMMHMMFAAHATGRKLLYIDMEMSKEETADRALALMLQVSADMVMTGKLNLGQFHEAKRLVEEFKDKPPIIFVDGDLRYGTRDLHAAIQLYKPDAIFVDGIYLMDDDGSTKSNNSWELQKAVIDQLKGINKKYKIPMVCSTQNINENRQTKSASMGNVAGGSTLVRHSSLVMEIRVCESNSNLFEMTVTKGRRALRAGTIFYVKRELDTSTIEFHSIKEEYTGDDFGEEDVVMEDISNLL